MMEGTSFTLTQAYELLHRLTLSLAAEVDPDAPEPMRSGDVTAEGDEREGVLRLALVG